MRSAGTKFTNRNITGELAESYVRQLFITMGWSPSKPNDFGVDCYVECFDPETRAKVPEFFAVQIKGTRSRRGVQSIRVPSPKIREWLESAFRVLFVQCYVNGNHVRAYYAWVDDHCYCSLGLPFGTIPKTSVTFAAHQMRCLRVSSRDELRSALANWKPPRATHESVVLYRQQLTELIQTTSKRRMKFLDWDLFSLPIEYRRRSASESVQAASFDGLLRVGARRILLLGKPGSGKTITSKRVLANSAPDMIPVDLRPLLTVLPAKLAEIKQAVCGATGIQSTLHFDALESACRFVFLVDGLNEIGQSDELSDSIARISKEWSNSRFLVTCRTGHFDQKRLMLHGFEHWLIADLSTAQQNEFLNRHPSVREAVRRAFRQHPGLRRLCRNQFIFMIVVQLAPERSASSLSKSEIYRVFFDEYLSWMKIDDPTLMIELLSTIAWTMRKNPVDRTLVSRTELRRVLTRGYGAKRAALYEGLLYDQGFIERSDGQCRFFQETLQEYLCARYLVMLKSVLPNVFSYSGGVVKYEGVEITEVIRELYLELSGFIRLQRLASADESVSSALERGPMD